MTVSGHKYQLDRDAVESALGGVLPEPIREHFIVINGRRWPPKQVLALEGLRRRRAAPVLQGQLSCAFSISFL
jgi:hypothetical protein